jgi:signal peptidase II
MTTAEASPAHSTPTEMVKGSKAWRSPSAWGIVAGVGVLALAIDLMSKYIAFARIADAPVAFTREDVLAEPVLGRLIPAHHPVEVIPGLLEFTLVLNPGAVFGIGAGKRWFFITFTAAALALAGWSFYKWIGARQRWLQMALGLLVGGAIGNLYDRLSYACVRDFLHPLPGWTYPFGISTPWSGREIWPYVSNIADLWLLIGVAIVLVKFWRSGHADATTIGKTEP